MGQLDTEHPELLKEWNYDKNGDLCPEDLTSGSGKKVWWICDKGHEWQTAVYNRAKGSGCPVCSGKQILAGFNDLATTNPNLGKQWHPTKNGDLTPQVVSAGTHRKVWWRCKQGHEWQAAVSDRSNGNGCPICAGNQILIGFNDLATTYPELADQWHPSKNGNLTPQNVSAGCNKKVWWICDQGHEWQDTANHRSSGRGCPYCSGRRVLAGFNDFATVHPELVAQWHPVKNGNLTPKDVTAGSNKKVWWICGKGHEWELSVSKRSSGEGCPYCSGHRAWPGFNDLASTHSDIVAQWHPTKNGNLTPQDVTAGSDKKVWWMCSKGHEWQAIVASRCAGNGCPICSGKKALAGFNDLAMTNPDLAKQWHLTKNGDLTPQDVTAGSGKKVWWVCDKGHEWQTAVCNRLKGTECPVCAGQRVLTGFNDLATVNPELVAQWHPSKNGNLKPEEVMSGSSKKVWWICNKGHEWQATISSRSKKGSGCPFCAGQRAQTGIDDLATLRPDIAAQWHPTKNGNLTPKDVKVASNKKVWWICDKEHEWEATPSARSAGNGCPYCSGHRAWAGFNDLATIRPDLAAQWHPTKNGELTPDKVTVASNKKAWWVCDKGHEWQAIISGRSSGNGCPICNSEKQTSFPEQAILYYLSRITTAESRYRIDEKREVDIFLPELNTAIEYDGWYWHKDSEAISREETKNKRLAKTGIRLIRVKEIGEDEQIPHDTKDAIYCRYTPNGEYLSNVIAKILERLGITDSIDVNLARDTVDIYDQYIKSEKEDSLASKLPEVAKEWHPTKNGKLTPENIPFSSGKKVWWMCSKRHEWQTTPNNRSAGNNCPYCSGHRAWPGFNDLATVQPELAAQWHPTRNGDLKPTDVTSASNKEVWWLCEQGHEWQAKVNDRKRGNGCPYCSGRQAISGVNDLATLRPDLASQWHPTKNGGLTPADVKVASSKKVWWMCDKGHEWQAAVEKRNYGGGCPICLGRKVLAGFNDLATINPKLAAQWHPTKNGDLTPQDVTAMSNKKVWWMCDKGHEWQAAVSDRSAKRGCPYCSGQRVWVGFNDLATVNPELASQWHPSKNDNLTPCDVTAGSGKKVWWVCDNGHEWQAVIGSRSSGSGCPTCSRISHKKKHS